MYSKEEAKKLRQEFWISFGKSFPRKWILYHTKVKGLSFKFHFSKKKAAVSVDFEQTAIEKRSLYFEKFIALKSILDTHISDLTFEENYLLDNGKTISSIYKELNGVSIHNKNTWQETMYFLKEAMEALELFWIEYEDYITS